MKKLALLLLITVTLVTVSCSKDKDLSTPEPKEKIQTPPSSNDKGQTTPASSVDSKAQTEMLKEINFLRSNPKGYAEKRLKPYYNKGEDNGAYKELIGTAPVKTLKLNSKLVSSAENYADVMAKKNKIGHTFGGGLGDRLHNFGYQWMGCGENVAYGSYPYYNIEQDAKEAAIRYVILYVIDRGVAGVGHRKNLLKKSWTEVGVGFGKNRTSYFNAQQFATGDFSK
ncbi:CAP domain-containing protein [Halosquirtibacter xylanolyticus]|uniref:CAP domain-containing protein n=1 Tax=Halosquirtibacter xylanolyticus TaxID=3374599 RepID=UPI00374A8E38|nr:CAP domain-containing protein [Prolixibacteraceae bacterium]